MKKGYKGAVCTKEGTRRFDVPRECVLEFDMECAETSKRMKKGEGVVWYPLEKKAFCKESKRWRVYCAWRDTYYMLKKCCEKGAGCGSF